MLRVVLILCSLLSLMSWADDYAERQPSLVEPPGRAFDKLLLPPPPEATRFFQPKDLNLGITYGTHRVKMGYDITSDTSKLEYAQGPLNVGVYQSATSSILFYETFLPLSNGTVVVGGRIAADLPAVSLSYGWSGQSASATITQAISKKISAQVSTTQSLNRAPVPDSYTVRLGFSF